MHSEAVIQWLDAAHVRSLAEGLLVPSPQGGGLTNEKMFGSAFIGYADPEESVAPVSAMARQSLSDAQSRAASSGILRERTETAPTEQAKELKQVTPDPVSPVQEIEPLDPEPAPEIEPAPAADPVPAPMEPTAQVPSISPVPTAPREEIEAPVPPEPAPEVKPTLIESPFRISSPTVQPAQPVRQVFRPLPLSTRLQAFGTWLTEQIPTRSYFICDRHGEIVVDEVGSEKLVKVARTLAHASSSAGRQVGEDQNLGSLHVKIGPDKVMEVVPRHSHFGLVVLGIIVQRPLSRDAVASISRALGTALAEPSAPREG
jgi:hypothetical protein